SKLAAEQLLAPFSAVTNVVIGRFFHLYGAAQRDKLFNDLARRLREGRPVELAGADGICLAPTYAEDAARLVRLALEQGWNGTHNIAAPDVVSLRHAAEEIGRVLGIAPAFIRKANLAPLPV